MPRRRKRKGEEQQTGLDITSFLEPLSPKEEAPKAAKQHALAETPLASSPVYQYVMSRRRVSKGELYKWCKARGIPLAELYRVIKELTSTGVVRRRFDDKLEDLVYEVVGQ